MVDVFDSKQIRILYAYDQNLPGVFYFNTIDFHYYTTLICHF